jgi:hypothetical protein
MPAAPVGWYPGTRRLVSRDRGAPHQGAAREPVGREASGRLRLEAQPAAVPARNLQEHIWLWWRRAVRPHHGWATRRAPIAAIRPFCRDLTGITEPGRR